MKPGLSVLDRIFLVSAVLGTAASYSVIYLFHIALSFKLLESVTTPITGEWRDTRRVLHWDLVFFIIFIVWYCVSFLWASNKLYAAMYCIYITLAALTVFYTAYACRTRQRLEEATRLLIIIVSLQIVLSIFEGLGIMRLPFSPYSPYYSYFGRDIDLSLLGVQAYHYVITLPTGFFHNTNNLAAFLALVLPFFVLHRRWAVRIIGTLATLYVVYLCGARVALLACGVVIFIGVFVWGGFSAKITAVSVAIAAVLLGAGLLNSMMVSANIRVAEFGGLGLAISDFWKGLLGDPQLGQGGSTAARAELIRNGFYALLDSYGVGVGAGGSQTIQEESAFQVGDLTSMHNFWMEILVEGGVPFASIFAFWYASFLWRLLKVARTSTSDGMRYFGRALFTGFLGFILGGVGPSSVIYMLPMWLMVGIGLAVIRVADLEREFPAPRSRLYQNLAGQPPEVRAFIQSPIR